MNPANDNIFCMRKLYDDYVSLVTVYKIDPVIWWGGICVGLNYYEDWLWGYMCGFVNANDNNFGGGR